MTQFVESLCRLYKAKKINIQHLNRLLKLQKINQQEYDHIIADNAI